MNNATELSLTEPTMTKNTTEDSSPGQADHIARLIFIFIGSLEVVSGVAGNCLLLIVLLTRVRFIGMRNFHHYFIANLALSDLVTLGYWMPFFVLDLILGKRIAENDAHCKANGFIIAVCLATGVFSLMFISLNRYLYVCHNHLYRRVFTRARTIACCVCIWVFSSLLAVPPWVNVGAYVYSDTTHICSFQRRKDDEYPKAVIFIFAVVPMCVVGYLNYKIFRYWKMARIMLSTKYPLIRTDQKKRQKALQMVADNRRIEMDHEDSEIQLEENVAEIIDTHKLEQRVASTAGIDRPETSKGVGRGRSEKCIWVDMDQSEPSTSVSQDAARELGAFHGETCVSDSPRLARQKDTQLHVQPALPLGNRHADNDLQEKNLQPLTVHTDLRNENKDEPQVLTFEYSPIQQQSQHCSSSQRLEAPRDTKRQKKEADTICSLGRRRHQLASTQVCEKSLLPTLDRGPSLTRCKQLSRRRRKEVAREMAFVRSLCVVFFLMLFCFFPFGVAMVVDSFKSLPSNVSMTCNLVLFFHCSVNWIVYGVMNRSFRRGYFTHVRCVVHQCWPRLCARLHGKRGNSYTKSTIRSRFAK